MIQKARRSSGRHRGEGPATIRQSDRPRPGPQGARHVLPLGAADKYTAPYKFAASIGLGGLGLIPHRPNDTFGIGYSYLDVTEINIVDHKGRGSIRSSTNTFEAYYGFALCDVANLTFDVQVAESELERLGRPVILGARLNFIF